MALHDIVFVSWFLLELFVVISCHNMSYIASPRRCNVMINGHNIPFTWPFDQPPHQA